MMEGRCVRLLSRKASLRHKGEFGATGSRCQARMMKPRENGEPVEER
jgi:hypothetical protein